MTTKDEVLAMHRRNPKWCAPEIARALRCTSAYVRKTARRNAITLPIGRREPVERVKVEAPPLTSSEPEPIRLTGNTYVVERYDPFAPAGNGRVQRITLPLLTIQTRAA